MKTRILLMAALTALMTGLSPIAPALSQSRTSCELTLTARDRNAEINIREGAGLNFRIKHIGIVGDRVIILKGNSDLGLATQKDDEGYVWYKVQFPESQAIGWVRKDFTRNLACGD